MVNFNPEINLGTLISLATFVFLAGGFFATGRSVFKQMGEMRTDLKKLNEVVTAVAVQNARLDNLEKRYDGEIQHLKEDIRDMKHWEGFITRPRNPTPGPA